MKNYLSEDYALILAEDSMIIDHPTMIFTDDKIKVSMFKDKDKLKKHIVDNVDKSEVKKLPDKGRELRKNQLYASDDGIFLCNEDCINDDSTINNVTVFEKIKSVETNIS